VQFDFENDKRLRVKIEIERRCEKKKYEKERNQIKENKKYQKREKHNFIILKKINQININYKIIYKIFLKYIQI